MSGTGAGSEASGSASSDTQSGAGRHPLDEPVLRALAGPHARFAQQVGRVLRYQPDVSPFLALPDTPRAQDWADAATLVGPAGIVPLNGVSTRPPADWTPVMSGGGVQMVDAGVAAADDPEATVLTAADVPEMLALVGRAKPGPFLPRTIELGRYLGIRRDGALIAMAGERLRPPGWTEISAVCTDEAFRGQGLGTRLVLAVAAGIRRRGDTPFLHAAAENVGAIRLYQSLGFRLRREVVFEAVQVPGRSAA